MFEKAEIIEHVIEKKIIAIIRGMGPEHILKLGEALFDGGIDMMEVTFNQSADDNYKATRDAIRLLKNEMGDHMYVGSGTVLTCEQVDMTIEAGGQYIITPSVDTKVIRYAYDKGLVTMPGALSASEVMEAHNAGADFVKIFPAGNMGPNYIKAIKAPLSHIRMLAVGGVNEKNIADFMDAGCVGAGVGGNLVNREWIENGEFDKITALAKKFTDAIR